MLRILGKSMGFRGYALDSFLMDYYMNVTGLMTISAADYVDQIADPDDKQKLEEIIKNLNDDDFGKQIEFGEFLGSKLMEYPEITQKIEKEVSDLNENILSSFLALAPQKHLDEFLDYLGGLMKENEKMKPLFEKVQNNPR